MSVAMNGFGLSTAAHEHVLPALASAMTEVRIASPFLGPGPMTELVRIASTKPSLACRLLTRLEINAVASGVLDINGIRRALRAGVKVRTLSNLHAKVYMADSRFAFVGSGNFTGAGMAFGGGAPNVELGVILDKPAAGQAWRMFGDWWKGSRPVTQALLDKVEAAAATIPPRAPMPLPPVGDPMDLSDHEIANDLLLEAQHTRTWLKAVYFTLDPNDRWGHGGWFASSKRGRPSFKPGDLVVIYADNLKTCNAVVEIAKSASMDDAFLRSEGVPRDQRERWPWINEVEGRMTVQADDGITLNQIGVDGRGLQNGHVELTFAQFSTVVRQLAAAGTL